MLLFRMPKINKTLARLNPRAREREKRLEQYLETESHEWMDVIERRRKERDEKERQIDLALHHERREGSNWLENREMRISDMVLEHERTTIFDHIEIRKRLALECPELLSDAELSKLEESMLRSVQVARQVRRDDYERRARAAGVPMHRPNQGDTAAHGDLEGMVRREVRQLELARRLGRMDKPGAWTREDRLKLAAWVVPSLLVLLGLLANVIGVEHLRQWLWAGR
jgi:hypothetical protein